MTNYLDLFSGIGGFALGAYWSGLRFDNHYFSEVDPYAVKIYQQRFPDAIPLGDITKITAEVIANAARLRRREIENGLSENGQFEALQERRMLESSGRNTEWIISGGFPCQDISVAGKGAGITGLRSGLWFHYARLISELRPRYAIMENVGALTVRGLDAVLGSLAEIGYDAQWSDNRQLPPHEPLRSNHHFLILDPKVALILKNI